LPTVAVFIKHKAPLATQRFMRSCRLSNTCIRYASSRYRALACKARLCLPEYRTISEAKTTRHTRLPAFLPDQACRRARL
jgi:hypothetical protein